MNIVLIGMRGSGKTNLARLLAKQLNRKVLSTDNLIENKIRKKISDIVKKSGWEKFRDLESSVIREISKIDNSIIDCGGGVVVRKENISLLKINSIIFWLDADVKTLLVRLGDDAEKPFLTNAGSRLEDIEITLNKRKKLYVAAADFIIKTDDKKPGQVAREIIKFLNHYD